MADTPTDTASAASAGPTISLGKASLHIGLSLVVLAVIGYFTFDAQAFGQMVQSINPWWLVAIAGSLVVRIGFGAWRLSYVSHGRLTFMAALRGQLAWDLFSNITPSAVGGGPLATLYVAHDQKMSFGQSSGLFLFSSLLDQLFLALTIPITLLAAAHFEVFPDTLGPIGTGAFIGYFLLMLGWVLVFGYTTMVRPDHMQHIADRLFRLRFLRRFRTRVAHEVSQMAVYARMLRTQPISFFINGFLMTTVSWLARYALIVFIVWSVYPEVDSALLFLRSMAMMLGTLLLPTPGGSGGIEGLYLLFLGPLMPDPLVAPTLLSWRVLGYYIFIAFGVFLPGRLFTQPLSLPTAEATEPATLPSNGSGDGVPPHPPAEDTPLPHVEPADPGS
ncbi:MAG: lysylphosphatidylglycerol synthase transmembrane domain-containing protein [Bacteroidota bacterium]